MPLSRVSLALLVACSILIALVFPLLVYFTYPNTEESELGLEKVLADMPVKPPPFLIGSMGYALHRGKELIGKFTVRGVLEHTIDAYRLDKGEQVVLVLLPYYLEESTGKILPGKFLKQLVARGDVTLAVQVFETHRGKVCVVIEVRLNGEVYSALRRFS